MRDGLGVMLERLFGSWNVTSMILGGLSLSLLMFFWSVFVDMEEA